MGRIIRWPDLSGLDDRYVNEDGDTMTGALRIDMEAAASTTTGLIVSGLSQFNEDIYLRADQRLYWDA